MLSLPSDQASFLLQISLDALRYEHAVTRRVIEAIPLDNGEYRPDAYSRSALELAWHIASTERRFLNAIAAGQFDLSPFPKPDSISNSADLGAWYGEMFAQRSAPLAQLTTGQLVTIIDFRGIFKLPAVAYLQVALNHSIHHRGQLSTYLRPSGGKVPAIYGESHDSAQAKSANV